MISIEGLTKKQAAMLDIIWAFNDDSEFSIWFSSLMWEDKLTVETLLELVKYELMESLLDLYETDAKEVIGNF